MTKHKNSSAGPVGSGTGAELKAASFNSEYYIIDGDPATTTFYWDTDSNSVQPLHDLRREVAA